MGQIKNIKLHIVTDIKIYQLYIKSTSTNEVEEMRHHPIH